MATRSTKPITAAQLREFAAQQDDFGFELEVHHIANLLNLSAQHAGFYADPATGKPRQFDVRATAVQGTLEIRTAIECKCLTAAYPLLISRVPRPRPDSIHSELYCDGTPSSGLAGHARIRNHVGKNSMYPPGQLVGKSMSQVGYDEKAKAFVGNDQVAFEKWMQAVASAGELVQMAAQDLRANRTPPPRILVIPYLTVSDGTLWAVDYTSSGTIAGDPKQIDETTFYIGRKVSLPGQVEPFHMTHLHLATRSAIRAVLTGLSRRSTDVWEEWFRES